MSHEDDDMFIVNGNRPTCVSVSSEELWNILDIIYYSWKPAEGGLPAMAH